MIAKVEALIQIFEISVRHFDTYKEVFLMTVLTFLPLWATHSFEKSAKRCI